MSQIITHSITCPFCGYMGNIAVTEKANIDSTTDIKEKLLKKLFFKWYIMGFYGNQWEILVIC